MSDMTPEKARAWIDALSDEGTRRCFAHCGEPDCECDAAARQVAWARMVLAKNSEALARAYIAQAAELTRLRAQIEAADKLVGVLRQMAKGWSNALELEIIAERHRGSARILQGNAERALSAYEDARK
jgi:hypothetical protein